MLELCSHGSLLLEKMEDQIVLRLSDHEEGWEEVLDKIEEES